METGRRKNVGGVVGALRTACDRQPQWDNPQLQEVRSLSSQSLLQLCGSRRPHSWSDLHLITLTNKAPNFVLKVARVFSDFKRSFGSSFLPGQTLLRVPHPEAPWGLLSLSKPSPRTVPRHQVKSLVKPNSLKIKNIKLKVCQILYILNVLCFLSVKE